MRFKMIMLVTFTLLAVLMVGAVSAGDDSDFNETLTVDEADEVPGGALANDETEPLAADEACGDSLETGDEDTLNGRTYRTFVNNEEEMDINSDKVVCGIIISPELKESGGNFVILNGDNEIFSIPTNNTTMWFKENGDYECDVQLNKINLTQIKDGDDLIFTFMDSNGNEVKNFRKMARVSLNNSVIKFYHPSLALEITIDCDSEFSINDLQTVFANVTISQNMRGRIVLKDDNGTILYEKNTEEFDDRYIHIYDYGLTLGDEGRFIFANLNDSDVVTFEFYNEQGNKIVAYSFYVHFKNNNTVQFEGIGYDDSLYFFFIGQEGKDDGWNWYGLLMGGMSLNPQLMHEGGYVVITDGDYEMYRSHTSEYGINNPRHWHVGDGVFKCHAYTNDIKLKNVVNGDLIKFAFITSSGVEIEKYTTYRFISIVDSAIHFSEKGDPNLNIGADDITEGDNALITVTANRFFTGNVSVEIEGSIYPVELINGTGSLPVPGLAMGKYNATATLYDTSLFYESVKNTTFSVKGKTNIKAPAIATTYGTSKTLVVTLKDSKGKALANKKVIIVFNGAEKTFKTNSKGQVSLPIGTALNANKYVAKFTFAGDSQYAKSSGSVNVVVNKAKAKLTAKNKVFKLKKSKKYTVILKTDKGKALGKVPVTIKGKGIKYTVKTNANGKAAFNLKKLTKKGKWTLKVEFKGNKNFVKAAKSVTIKVKK